LSLQQREVQLDNGCVSLVSMVSLTFDQKLLKKYLRYIMYQRLFFLIYGTRL